MHPAIVTSITHSAFSCWNALGLFPVELESVIQSEAELGMEPLLTTTHIVDGFVAGEISREEAMQHLHMVSYSELLNALADRGITPPKPPVAQVEAELEAAMPILQMMDTTSVGLGIAIADSGPLISLARIGRLGLLDRFNCPVMIADMALDELLRGMPGAPGAMIFHDWFRNGGNRIQTIETGIGMLWNALPPDQQALRRRIKDAGETSIWQFSNRLRGTLGASDYRLLLFEENQVKSMDFGPRIAKITTWSFLVGLERMGVLPSAEALHDDLSSEGRNIRKDPFERQAAIAEAGASWTDMYDKS